MRGGRNRRAWAGATTWSIRWLYPTQVTTIMKHSNRRGRAPARGTPERHQRGSQAHETPGSAVDDLRLLEEFVQVGLQRQDAFDVGRPARQCSPGHCGRRGATLCCGAL